MFHCLTSPWKTNQKTPAAAQVNSSPNTICFNLLDNTCWVFLWKFWKHLRQDFHQQYHPGTKIGHATKNTKNSSPKSSRKTNTKINEKRRWRWSIQENAIRLPQWKCDPGLEGSGLYKCKLSKHTSIPCHYWLVTLLESKIAPENGNFQ